MIAATPQLPLVTREMLDELLKKAPYVGSGPTGVRKVEGAGPGPEGFWSPVLRALRVSGLWMFLGILLVIGVVLAAGK